MTTEDEAAEVTTEPLAGERRGGAKSADERGRETLRRISLAFLFVTALVIALAVLRLDRSITPFLEWVDDHRVEGARRFTRFSD